MRREVLLAANQRPRIVIQAPLRLFEEATAEAPPAAPPPGKHKPRKKRKPRLTKAQQAARQEQLQLRRAVDDLAHYLSKLSGGRVDVTRGPGQVPGGVLPILLGELGEQRFGPVAQHTLGKQSFRYVVSSESIALYGESDLATGYAIYELLDRLGCRWFMPGELGEHVPQPERLVALEADETLRPTTLYRNLWYADDDFKRRNRLGGARIAAGHMLEKWITAAQRDEHPEWRATIGGKPHAKRLRWGDPEVARAIAKAIDARLARKPVESVSISPLDGSDFDDGRDKAIDAGDFDPTTNQVSLTDRLMVLANRVAGELAPKHPDLTLGLLAYVSYTRPPVREKVHPSVVPVIAPITYCRPRPWSDDSCPGAKELRQIIQGWAARSERIAFRGYGFNLAEPAAPNPMMGKWSSDLPFLFANKTLFFQPETLPNFESSLPALYLGIRLSWNSARQPAAVLRELFDGFYGHASTATRAYLDLIDRAWLEAPVFAGAGLGYARRFPPDFMRMAREALEKAKRACQTDTERQRVAMLDESLSQLERYMKLDTDFREGRFGELDRGLANWLERAAALGDRYAANSAFGRTNWAKASVYGAYVKRFLEPLYKEASRIQRDQVLLTSTMSCHARYRFAPDLKVPLANMPQAPAPEAPKTDFCRDTWSTLGRHDYFGGASYETTLELATSPPGKRAYLWLSKVDGIAQVWINDQLVRPKDADPNAPASAETHLKALTFDVTAALKPGPNKLLVAVQRTRLAELGAGGLMGPIAVYRDR